MAEGSIGIGVIGAGNISYAHLQAFSQLPDARLVAVADVVQPMAQKRAAEFNIPHVYGDHRLLLERADVDAAVVCVPNFLHAPVAIEALAAGKHVLCEKPMATDPAAAAAMVEAAKRAQKILMIGLNYRYRADSRYLKKEIERGAFGTVYFGKTGWFRRRGIPGWGTWFTQKSKSGGGPLIDIGVHMLDLCWWLMGSPRPVSVSGATFAAFGPKKEGLGTWGTPNFEGYFDVEDLASGFIKCENGAAITLDVSWAAHTPDRHFLSVMGEKAGASMFEGGLRIYTTQGGQNADIVPETAGENERMVLSRHFLECVRTGQTPISSGEQGLWVTRMLDGLYRSAATGREVLLG